MDVKAAIAVAVVFVPFVLILAWHLMWAVVDQAKRLTALRAARAYATPAHATAHRPRPAVAVSPASA